MNSTKSVAIAFQAFGIFLAVSAVALALLSILTHNWQVFLVSDTGKFQSHYHGLWMDCIEETVFVTDSKTKTCFYKFHDMNNVFRNQYRAAHRLDDTAYMMRDNMDRDYFDPGYASDRLARLDAMQSDRLYRLLETKLTNMRQHKVLTHEARKAVLSLLVVGAGLGLIGMFTSYCAASIKWSGFAWAILSFFASLFALAGVVMFFINTHDFDNMYTAGSTRSSLTHGYSFYCAIASSALFFLASIAAALTAVLYKVVASQKEDLPPVPFRAKRSWPPPSVSQAPKQVEIQTLNQSNTPSTSHSPQTNMPIHLETDNLPYQNGYKNYDTKV